MPRFRLLRHVARLVVDYFDNGTRPGASARHVAHHPARRAARRRILRLDQAHRRLLRLRRASGCLGTSCGSSRGITPLVVDYSASRRLVIDYFASAVRSGASARRAARHVAHRAARHRLLCLAQARRRLLCLT
jgi:hypothetical protein